jgi:uncharacterized FAD-dependent dehydrogenase
VLEREVRAFSNRELNSETEKHLIDIGVRVESRNAVLDDGLKVAMVC